MFLLLAFQWVTFQLAVCVLCWLSQVNLLGGPGAAFLCVLYLNINQRLNLNRGTAASVSSRGEVREERDRGDADEWFVVVYQG